MDFSSQPPQDSHATPGDATDPPAAASKWRPLTSRQRRVAGVLVEKARTTPDTYPMTLNGLVSGCNQKSNRSPQMNLNAEAVEETLDELRELGAIAEVHTGGRVPKYRHYLYEWLGVDKVEMAVMTELLLRGEQTLGELRTRASRMEQIDDLDALRQVVDRLIERGLMVALTRPGRGQIVTHGLYQARELDQLRNQYDGSDAGESPQRGSRSSAEPASRADESDESGSLAERLEALEARVQSLEARVGELLGDAE